MRSAIILPSMPRPATASMQDSATFVRSDPAARMTLKAVTPKQGWLWQIVAALIINLLSLALPIMMLQIYDRIIPHKAYDTLIVLITGVVLALALDAALRLARAYLTGHKSALNEHNTGCMAMARLTRADMAVYEKTPIGNHLQNMNALGRLRDFYSGHSLTALVDLPFVFLFLGLTAYLGHWLVLAPAGLLVLFLLSARISGSSLRKALEKRSLVDERKSSFIISVLKGIHSVKALAIEAFLAREFDAQQKAVTKASYAVAAASGSSVILSTAFGQLSLLVTATVGGVMVLQGLLSVGSLSACTLLAGRTIQPVQRVLSTWLRMQDLVVARDQANELFAIPVQPRNQAIESVPAGQVKIKNLSFSYDGKLLLDNISLDIKPGEAVALQGDKGSGKSTLLQLMAGILTPQSGTIRLDGLDPAYHGLAELEKFIGYLPQQGAIFKGTLLENITGFRDDEESIMRAKMAGSELGLDAIVNILPKGYETALQDSVADPIPPGVKQRLALTRVLAHEPAVLVFDDADRALDKEGYNRLFRLMGSLKGKRTLIIVSQDQNLLSFADDFYYLSGGRLVQQEKSTAQHLSFLTLSKTGRDEP